MLPHYLVPGTFPIPHPQGAAAKAAEKLHQSWGERAAAVKAVETDYRQAHQDVQATSRALDAELRRAAEAGRPSEREGELAAALLAAQDHVRQTPWRRRADAARGAVETARVAYQVHVNKHLEELLEELRPGAEQATEAVHQAARAYTEATEAYSAHRTRVDRLLAHADAIDGQSLPVAQLPRLGDLGHVPIPMPAEQFLAYRRELLNGAPAEVEA